MAAAGTAHARQGSNTSSTASMGYPPAPGSPTLTNPDMILPDYDVASSPNRSQSPLMLWQDAQADGMHYQHPAAAPHALTAGPVTPTTPIIYGNGTMLSDIGEVTEAESVIGRSPDSSLRRSTDRSDKSVPKPDSRSDPRSDRPPYRPAADGPARDASPVRTYEGVKKRSKAQVERRSSVDSNSTVTTIQDGPGHFDGFDDAVSVDDSNFQGDDEESVAESTLEDRQSKFLPQPPGVGLNNDNRHSTASLSQRAEEILANAKRRLTTMEGNLNRARTSLHSASPSNSSINSGTPSPPVVRSGASITSPSSAPGHARMLSDTSISNNDNATFQTTRSASALGAAGGYRQPIPGLYSTGDLGKAVHRHRNIPQHPLDPGLEPLSEDGVGLAENVGPGGAKLDGFLSPTFGSGSDYGPDQGLTRSTSVMQMRDIKDQMQGLKGKISTLRNQARADSMKRRSLQSLRTPSPFTHARIDQWYAAPAKPDPPGNGTTPLGRNPWNGELESVDGEGLAKGDGPRTPPQEDDGDEGSVISEYVVAQETVAIGEPEAANAADGINGANAEDMDDMRTEDGHQGYDDGHDQMDGLVGRNGDTAPGGESFYDDDQSESGDSVYHDSFDTLVSHEDREDAFDYEHFFLHSAMGSFSQHGTRRDSETSYSSDDSVETTRGPVAASAGANGAKVRRRGSGDTFTSMDSFATADEGRSSTAHSTRQAVVAEDGRGSALSTDERVGTPSTTAGTFGPGADADTNEDMFASLSGTERPRTSVGISGHQHSRSSSVIYSRPFSGQAVRGRPSRVASLDSAGTHRSFPLVNRRKMTVNGSDGVLTPLGTPPPHGSTTPSPDAALKHVSESLMSETASVFGGGAGVAGEGVGQLAKEDQILVERLVASLGRCVLGLSETGRASAESRAFRRRIEAAKKLLDGDDEG